MIFLITTWVKRVSVLPPEVAGEELGVPPEGAMVLLPREVDGGEELEVDSEMGKEVGSPVVVISVASVGCELVIGLVSVGSVGKLTVGTNEVRVVCDVV